MEFCERILGGSSGREFWKGILGGGSGREFLEGIMGRGFWEGVLEGDFSTHMKNNHLHEAGGRSLRVHVKKMNG